MEENKLSISQRPLGERINGFLGSPYFVLCVILAALLSNCFGWELFVYTLFVVVAVYCCFFGRDLLPLIPLVVCGYLAPSVGSNPGKNPESVFTWEHGGWYIALLAGVLVAALVIHIIIYAKHFFAKKRMLLPGMLALFGAYLLSGLFSPAYPDLALRNLGFAAMQGAALLVPYCLISGGVRWHKNRKDYFCWTGFGVGCLLLGELCWIYLTGGIIEEGVIQRDGIYTGWGQHNNIGGMMAMMVPFAFYLGSRYKKPWVSMLAGTAFLGGVFMSCSRSSILFGCAAYAVCVAVMLFKSHNKKVTLVTLGVSLVAAGVMVLVFRHTLVKLFWNLISLGANPSYRDVTWSAGLQQFLKYPIFGGSFYPIDFTPWDFSEVAAFSKFYPPRWHNTVVQLLACTGTVGIFAYIFHRVQTGWLLLKQFNREKAFIGCSVLVLLGTCMFDCHFYNIGPVLFYSMGLAFAENCSACEE